MQRKGALRFAESQRRCKGAPVSGQTPLSPEAPREGPRGRLGQDTCLGAKRKDSLSPAVSRYQRKGALVSESTPHSPEPTRKGLLGRSG